LKSVLNRGVVSSSVSQLKMGYSTYAVHLVGHHVENIEDFVHSLIEQVEVANPEYEPPHWSCQHIDEHADWRRDQFCRLCGTRVKLLQLSKTVARFRLRSFVGCSKQLVRESEISDDKDRLVELLMDDGNFEHIYLKFDQNQDGAKEHKEQDDKRPPSTVGSASSSSARYTIETFPEVPGCFICLYSERVGCEGATVETVIDSPLMSHTQQFARHLESVGLVKYAALRVITVFYGC
jgi:hypothetical protein